MRGNVLTFGNLRIRQLHCSEPFEDGESEIGGSQRGESYSSQDVKG